MRYTAVRCNPPIGHFQLAKCKAFSHFKNGSRNPHEGEVPASGSWPMLSSEMLLCSYVSSVLSIFLVLPVTVARLLCSEPVFNPLNPQIKSHLLFAGIISSPFSPR